MLRIDMLLSCQCMARSKVVLLAQVLRIRSEFPLRHACMLLLTTLSEFGDQTEPKVASEKRSSSCGTCVTGRPTRRACEFPQHISAAEYFPPPCRVAIPEWVHFEVWHR